MRSSINILKFLGILLILLRHVGWYFKLPAYEFLTTLFLPMGELGVHIFLFCSGYGLTYSALRSDNFVFSTYWKKRFIRVYPLYIFSLLLYTQLIYQIDLKNFLFHAFFIHSFSLEMSHNPDPLWYMGVLFQLYLLFPLLYNLSKKNAKTFWIFVVTLYVLNYIVIFIINSKIPFSQRLESNVEDSSMFSFIIPISVGITLAIYSYYDLRDSILSLKRNIIFGTLIGFTFILLYTYISGNTYQSFYEGIKIIFPFISSCSILIFLDIFRFFNNIFINKIILYSSSGVFCCYLFYEFIFHFFSLYISKSFIIIPFAIVFALVLSVYIQRGYNFFIDSFRAVRYKS